MVQVNTTVFANGQVLQWQVRNDDERWFKVYLTIKQLEYIRIHSPAAELMIKYCPGDTFATIMRLVSKM